MLSFMRSVGYMEEKYWYDRCMQMIIVTFNRVIISAYNYNFHICYPMVTKRHPCDLVFLLVRVQFETLCVWSSTMVYRMPQLSWMDRDIWDLCDQIICNLTRFCFKMFVVHYCFNFATQVFLVRSLFLATAIILSKISVTWLQFEANLLFANWSIHICPVKGWSIL